MNRHTTAWPLGSDETTPYKVFVPASAGQERVWIERGFTHSAVTTLITNEDSIELITGDGEWRGGTSGTMAGRLRAH